MTDKEIIKALETCKQYLNYDTHTYMAVKRGLDLINRQKAEIEKLKQSQVIHIDISEQFRKECEYEIKKAKSEAIKEFAEELKKKLIKKMSLAFDRNCYSYKAVISYQTSPETIDDVVKEMTEGENG